METENIMLCDRCNGRIIFKETKNLTHHGKLVCEDCNKWFKWVSSPDKAENNNRRKTSKHNFQNIVNFHKLNHIFCFFCLRVSDQLGEKEVMTIDHIQELNKGGEDKIENLQILCTACHKLKNWARLYTNWHNNKSEDIN